MVYYLHPITHADPAPGEADGERMETMTQAAANASAATELRNAAWIRNQIAATDKRSNRRAGMIDAFRDAIRTARYLRVYRQLSAA